MEHLKNNNPLQTVIDILNKQLENIPKTKSGHKLETYQEVKQHMEKDIFTLLDYDQLFFDNNGINSQDFYELGSTLKVLRNNNFIKITDEQKEYIKNHTVYQNLLKHINEKIEELTPGKDIEQLIEELEKINKGFLENSTIDKLYNIIQKYGISKEETLIIFKKLTQHINMISKQQEIKTYTVLPKLTQEQLIELFSKYGYDFNKVSKDLQTTIINKGNMNNIEEMFINLPKYGIKFNEKSKMHIYLIIKSSKEALETIMKLSEEYGFSFSEITGAYPSVLLHKNNGQEIKKNGKNEINPQEVDQSWQGAFEDFCNNIELIKSLGCNITEAIKDNPSVFIVSYTRLSLNARILKEYGFLDENNLLPQGFKLSGLKSTNLQEIIDIFIELGEMNYLKVNASRLRLESDSYIIKRIYFAKKHGIEYKSERKNKTTLKGIISDEKTKTLDRYIDIESIKHTIFDEKIDDEIKSTIERILKSVHQTAIEQNSELPEVNTLDQTYKRNEMTYSFNGTIISIRKVKKLYPILLHEFPELDKRKLLLYAITYNSMMDENEFNNIKNIIVAKEKTL